MLIALFFVTSSDSGSLVIDSLASGGATNTPVWQRVFWASISGLVAIALLLAGGLSALQAAAVISALPFAVIMIVAAIGMWRALVIEEHHETSLAQHTPPRAASGGRGGRNQWKKRLANLVDFPSKEAVLGFIQTTVINSMENVRSELQSQGWEAAVQYDEANKRALFEVYQEAKLEFIYEIRLRGYELPDIDLPTDDIEPNEDGVRMYYRAEVFLRRGGQAYDIYGYESQDIIADILDQFEKYMHFLHVSPGILPWDMAEHDEDLHTEDQESTDEVLDEQRVQSAVEHDAETAAANNSQTTTTDSSKKIHRLIF